MFTAVSTSGPARLTVAVGALTAYAQGFTAAGNRWRGREYPAVRHERYPTPAAHTELGNDDFDTSFGLGLDTILDGIAAQLPGPPSR
ncbi:TetR/AcrR family transcriptional regulator C-terminal domain-containing protein [Streptomyces carpaticus]|uniref:TetR/AcrR family transcriptional regulator C-terminal domain-containing protein n=1 Tax=Streptomyces carpaticus TaxID=285558 RepID=A0ABV4ZH72_9ACTN